VYTYTQQNAPSPGSPAAVLPLSVSGQDSAAEDLGMKLQKALSIPWSKRRILKVISGRAVFRIRGKTGDPQKMGKEIECRCRIDRTISRNPPELSEPMLVIHEPRCKGRYAGNFRLNAGKRATQFSKIEFSRSQHQVIGIGMANDVVGQSSSELVIACVRSYRVSATLGLL
jgi:hypothetical protein